MIKLLALLRPLMSFVPGLQVLASIGSIASAVASFFATPLGKCVGVALLVAGAYVGGSWHQAHIDAAKYQAEWSAAVAASQQQAAARDQRIRTEMTEQASGREAAIRAEFVKVQQKASDYETALSAANAARCAATADDARRLRELQGTSGDATGRRSGLLRRIVERGSAARRAADR